MLLDQPKMAAGCDLNLDVLKATEPDLLLPPALQALKPISDITADEKMRAAA